MANYNEVAATHPEIRMSKLGSVVRKLSKEYSIGGLIARSIMQQDHSQPLALTSFAALGDWMQENPDHEFSSKFNWGNVHGKLALDKVVSDAVTSNTEGGNTHPNAYPQLAGLIRGEVDGKAYPWLQQALSQIKSEIPNASNDDIIESARRNHIKKLRQSAYIAPDEHVVENGEAEQYAASNSVQNKANPDRLPVVMDHNPHKWELVHLHPEPIDKGTPKGWRSVDGSKKNNNITNYWWAKPTPTSKSITIDPTTDEGKLQLQEHFGKWFHELPVNEQVKHTFFHHYHRPISKEEMNWINLANRSENKPELFAKKVVQPVNSIVAHAAAVMDNPLEKTGIQSFADHLAETYPDSELSKQFLNWVNGGNWDELKHLIHPSKVLGYQPRGGYEYSPAKEHPQAPEFETRSDNNKELPIYGKNYKDTYWVPRSINNQEFGRYPLHTRPMKKKLSSVEVANSLHELGGVPLLIQTIIGLNHFHPENARITSGDEKVKLARKKKKKNREWVSKKIKFLMNQEGYKQSQAVAVALSMAGRSKYSATCESPTSLLTLPDIRQKDNFSCGACAAMAAGQFRGVGPSKLTEWKKALGTSEKNSTFPQNIVAYLSELGLQVEARQDMSVGDLYNCWCEGKPVICCIQEYGVPTKQTSTDYGHYVVSIGVSLGNVFVFDPSVDNVMEGEDADGVLGTMMISEARFNEVWHDQFPDGKKYNHYGIIVGEPVAKEKYAAEKPDYNQILANSIQRWKNFKPSVERPSPGHNLGENEFEQQQEVLGRPHEFADASAVLAGSKPAALVSSDWLLNHPLGQLVHQKLNEAGHASSKIGNNYGHAIGQPNNVEWLHSAYANLNNLNHGVIGRALGYPAGAIARFNHARKNGIPLSKVNPEDFTGSLLHETESTTNKPFIGKPTKPTKFARTLRSKLRSGTSHGLKKPSFGIKPPISSKIPNFGKQHSDRDLFPSVAEIQLEEEQKKQKPLNDAIEHRRKAALAVEATVALDKRGDKGRSKAWDLYNLHDKAATDLVNKHNLDPNSVYGYPKISKEEIEAEADRHATSSPPANELTQYAALRAPKGGMIVRGLYYPGGQVIPNLEQIPQRMERRQQIARRYKVVKIRAPYWFPNN